MHGRQVTYALNDDMSLNIVAIEQFLADHANSDILVFGFTYIVWLHFVLELELRQFALPLERGLLIHGGGWKKLVSDAVTKDEFKRRLAAVTSINRVHNYYGLAEQAGSIFMECEKGFLHASAWSDILIRDVVSHKVLPHGHTGLIQIFSLLPRSYPGHSLLTEDIGHIEGLDSCQCGRKGIFFEVHGRLPKSESRGCSDTYTR